MKIALKPLNQIKLPEDWLEHLASEFDKEYMLKLKEKLMLARQHSLVFPPAELIFNALNLTPFNLVKVVLIGQDPYHGKGQANGLCFSVNKGIKTPPSLANIYKELNSDMGLPIPTHGDLSQWAKQGILLLNATLTVSEASPGSHAGWGWEIFTDKIIEIISQKKENVVFLLWGKHAQQKSILINDSKHLILKAAHPSPFSAYNGFLGCKHFSQTNSFLISKNISPIDWKINE